MGPDHSGPFSTRPKQRSDSTGKPALSGKGRAVPHYFRHRSAAAPRSPPPPPAHLGREPVPTGRGGGEGNHRIGGNGRHRDPGAPLEGAGRGGEGALGQGPKPPAQRRAPGGVVQSRARAAPPPPRGGSPRPPVRPPAQGPRPPAPAHPRRPQGVALPGPERASGTRPACRRTGKAPPLSSAGGHARRVLRGASGRGAPCR